MRKLMMVLQCSIILIFCAQAEALIVINEVFADPAIGIAGDANNDRIRSSSNDEFIEILNFGNMSVNISGWRLSDAVSARHIFSANTFLLPYKYIVIFGGGTPNLANINWQTASSGGLSLNNGGDTVSLLSLDSQLVDQVVYNNLADQDQSIVRFPEGQGGQFVLHSSLSNKGELFSPGRSVNGENIAQTSVPEPASVLYFMVGILFLFSKRLVFC